MASPEVRSVREDLAAAIHETSNALTVILGWIERARRSVRDNPEATSALARAARYARSSRDVMRRAIGAAVPESGHERAGLLTFRTAEDLSMVARDARVVLDTELDNDLRNLGVPYPEAAWQILTNLLLNAVEL